MVIFVYFTLINHLAKICSAIRNLSKNYAELIERAHKHAHSHAELRAHTHTHTLPDEHSFTLLLHQSLWGKLLPCKFVFSSSFLACICYFQVRC